MHQHNHNHRTNHDQHYRAENHTSLTLQITNYFMGSACPQVEGHVAAVVGVYKVALNRTTGIIEVGFNPKQVTPEAIIDAERSL